MEIIRRKPYWIPTYKTEEVLSKLHKKITPATSSRGSLATLKFTPEQEKAFLNHIVIGLSPTEAAIALKMPVNEVKEYIAANINAIKVKIAAALLQRKTIHLSRLATAGKNWQASAFYLERKHKDEFGRDNTITINKDKKNIMRVNGQDIEF